MDFLNQAFSQVRGLFRSMTPGARITAGLLLAVVVVSLVFLFRQQVSGGNTYLMGGEPFSAGQLPAMEAAFAKANLNDYEIEGNRIRVPRGKQASYMGALADAGALPPNFGTILQKALDVDSPFMSKTDKLERLKAAKQSELALILRSMQGIENASVIYDIKRRSGLNREELATASVNIKPIGTEPLAAERIPMIRNLVASSIAGMKRSNVTVTDLNGRAYPGGDGADGFDNPLEDEYYTRKQMVEKDTRQKVMSHLAYIPGVDVQVSAELDTIKSHEEEKTDVDPRVVPTVSETTTESETNRNTAPAGRPGLAAQARPQAAGPAAGATLSAGSVGRTNESQKEKTIERSANVVSQSKTKITYKGLTPKKVRVTVKVPSKYYDQIWQTKNPAAEGEEPKKPDPAALTQIEDDVRENIQKSILALLPRMKQGEDPYPDVVVTSYQSLPVSPLADPSMTTTAVAYIGQYWGTLGMFAVAVFSLLMLRSMLKSIPAPEPTPSAVGPSLALVSPEGSADEPIENLSEEEQTQRLKRRIRKGPSLQDDLSEMVREDPDAAASILKNWISHAG